MQTVKVVRWCDYPDCANRAHEQSEDGQETTVVDFWFYVPGRGRKTNVLRVEMCADHIEQMKYLQQALSKYNQKGGGIEE